MEIINKTFKIINTGVTSGATGYSMNILLNANMDDMGLFDTYEDTLATGATGASLTYSAYTITATSRSRLVELRKFTRSTDLGTRYKTSLSPSSNGLDLFRSVTTGTDISYVYYIDGITYTDSYKTTGETSGTTATTYSFISSGTSSPAFDNKPIIKDDSIFEIIEEPTVGSNVFIIRQEIPVFENNYRLKSINELSHLTFYGGGRYFNIIENT
jgi:hypothetical protein